MFQGLNDDSDTITRDLFFGSLMTLLSVPDVPIQISLRSTRLGVTEKEDLDSWAKDHDIYVVFTVGR